jgi:uncharacterized protein (TIGR00369 family)
MTQLTVRPERVAERVRTVAWDDPVAAAEATLGLPGLDVLRGIQAGELPPPPMALLLGFAIEEVEHGRVVFSVAPGEHLYNPLGAVHGGVAATLIDTVTGCALHSTLPPAAQYTTADLKVTYTRPITSDTGRVLAEGTLLHRGRRMASAEARVTAEATGKLLAHGTATLLLLS